jgi:CBS domain-containing membrane protein
VITILSALQAFPPLDALAGHLGNGCRQKCVVENRPCVAPATLPSELGSMRKNVSVSHIMSTELVTVHHGDPISKVRATFSEHSLHHLPVIDGDKIVGIISWTDLMRLSYGDAFDEDNRAVDAMLDHTHKLEDLMHKNPVTVDLNSGVRDATRILSESDFHALPVVENGNKLVGMVTTGDLLKFLLEMF